MVIFLFSISRIRPLILSVLGSLHLNVIFSRLMPWRDHITKWSIHDRSFWSEKVDETRYVKQLNAEDGRRVEKSKIGLFVVFHYFKYKWALMPEMRTNKHKKEQWARAQFLYQFSRWALKLFALQKWRAGECISGEKSAVQTKGLTANRI